MKVFCFWWSILFNSAKYQLSMNHWSWYFGIYQRSFQKESATFQYKQPGLESRHTKCWYRSIYVFRTVGCTSLSNFEIWDHWNEIERAPIWTSRSGLVRPVNAQALIASGNHFYWSWDHVYRDIWNWSKSHQTSWSTEDWLRLRSAASRGKCACDFTTFWGPHM